VIAWSWGSFAAGVGAALFLVIGVGVVAAAAGARRGGLDNGLPPPPKPPEERGDPL
jgi:hypothetical protein